MAAFKAVMFFAGVVLIPVNHWILPQYETPLSIIQLICAAMFVLTLSSGKRRD